MKSVVRAALVGVLACVSSAATATTFYSTKSSFLAAATSPTTTETFEGIGTVFNQSSLTFANGTASGPSYFAVLRDPDLCGAEADYCLIGQYDGHSPRTLSDFAANLTGIGFDLHALNPNDAFTATVFSRAGSQTFNLTGTTSFLGFTDGSGILSIVVQNFGDDQSLANYGFDNVTTFTSDNLSTVPEPSQLTMLGAGLALFGAMRRQKRRQAN